jgi:hypothetical protein
VLHDQLLRPFHVQYDQLLQPGPGYEPRRAFCEWRLQRDASSLAFLCRVLINEAGFTRNWILNTRNQHTWLLKIHIPFQKHDTNSSFQ